MSGSIRGSTSTQSHPSNPHCCACNNAIISNMSHTNSSSYNVGHEQIGMYHGHPNVHNHNSHSHHVQHGHQEMYHNSNDHRTTHPNAQLHHPNNAPNYGSRDLQRMTKSPPAQDATQYYICECTSCRNLGNSVDICCQCCNCGNMTATIVRDDGDEQEIISDYTSSRGYHVSSVALTGDAEDTLEVVFDDGDDGATDVIDDHELSQSNLRKMNKRCNNAHEQHHRHEEDVGREISDDIAYAHTMAESNHHQQGRQIQKHLTCSSCNSCACTGKPIFQGWSNHHNLNSNIPHHHHQNHSDGMYSEKSYHHQHHHGNSQGTLHNSNQQSGSKTSPNPQQHRHCSQSNNRVLSNHHHHPMYNNTHNNPNNGPQQGRSNNGHHPKQFHNRIQKSNSCCSQGNNKPGLW